MTDKMSIPQAKTKLEEIKEAIYYCRHELGESDHDEYDDDGKPVIPPIVRLCLEALRDQLVSDFQILVELINEAEKTPIVAYTGRW